MNVIDFFNIKKVDNSFFFFFSSLAAFDKKFSLLDAFIRRKKSTLIPYA